MSHLFITRANIAHVACDAWLLPTGPGMNLTRSWRESVSEDEVALGTAAYTGKRGSWPLGTRVMPLDPGDEMTQSRAWLTNVGGGRGRAVEWYLEAVTEFLDRAGEWLSQHPRVRNGRERPLVGLPLVGTGFGGARDVKGQVTHGLLSMLANDVERRPFDIVVVAFDAGMLAALQQTRLELADHGRGNAWPELRGELVAEAQTLAARARRGDLVLFLGAGVSAGAGLPTWSALLDDRRSLRASGPLSGPSWPRWRPSTRRASLPCASSRSRSRSETQ